MRRKVLCLTYRHDPHGMPTNGMRVARGFHELGYNVRVMEHGKIDPRAVQEADVIIALGTIIYKKNINEVVKVARTKRTITPFILWYFDACCPQWKPGHGKYRGVCNAATNLDWLATTDHSYPWEQHIPNYIHLMQGVDAHEFQDALVSYSGGCCDVVFVGTQSGSHHERRTDLEYIKKHFSLATYGADSRMLGMVFGANLVRAYQDARVAYVPKPPRVIPGPYWSNRIYTAAATGVPCVVGHTNGIDAHYEHEKEVLYFDNKVELVRNIRLLLTSQDLRKKLGQAARERTLAEHTYTQRVKMLMEKVDSDGHGHGRCQTAIV